MPTACGQSVGAAYKEHDESSVAVLDEGVLSQGDRFVQPNLQTGRAASSCCGSLGAEVAGPRA
eukprot:6115504-Lingulodinium_polyedra.AAC.1